MSERQSIQPNIFYRILAVSLALALSVTNSFLFIFVIWDMLSPSQPFSVILFVGSGGAHLAYFFLPWFVKEMLAPLLRRPVADSARLADQNSRRERKSIEGLATVCTMFAVLLGVTTTGLWLVQLLQEDANFAMITKANCEQVGGSFHSAEKKLVCVIDDPNP